MNTEYINKLIRLNSHHRASVTGAQVLCKRGNITLEIAPAGLVISDGWFTNWITVYGSQFKQRWGADSFLGLSNSVIRTRLNEVSNY